MLTTIGPRTVSPSGTKRPNREEQTTEDLAKANGVDVTTADKRVEEIAHRVVRQLRHRHEMEEGVRAKDDESESNEQTDEQSDDFHDWLLFPKSQAPAQQKSAERPSAPGLRQAN